MKSQRKERPKRSFGLSFLPSEKVPCTRNRGTHSRRKIYHEGGTRCSTLGRKGMLGFRSPPRNDKPFPSLTKRKSPASAIPCPSHVPPSWPASPARSSFQTLEVQLGDLPHQSLLRATSITVCAQLLVWLELDVRHRWSEAKTWSEVNTSRSLRPRSLLRKSPLHPRTCTLSVSPVSIGKIKLSERPRTFQSPSDSYPRFIKTFPLRQPSPPQLHQCASSSRLSLHQSQHQFHYPESCPINPLRP